MRASMRRTGWRALAVAAAFGLLAAACSKGSSAPPPKIGPLVGFDETATANANGVIPLAEPFFNCGSTSQAFGTELLNSAPNKAKVRYEWGQIIPGQQMYEVGTASGTVVGHGGDLPFTHPMGDDLTSNIRLDRPYLRLSQKVGIDPTNIPSNSLHTEWPEKLLPGDGNGNIMPGFEIQDGDRVAAYGDWILDCGHADFHTEIHPPAFSAYGHAEGTKTVAHAVFNPYDVSQLFNPDPSLAANFADSKRLTNALTQAFPLYLYQELLRLAGLGPDNVCCADQLAVHELISPNTTPASISWYVCAPAGGGGSLSVSYHFTTRPGVTISESTDQDLGCAKFTATIGKDYSPLVPTRQDCELSWDTLTEQAEEAVGGKLDVKAAIEAQVPKSLIPKVEKPPIIDCYQLPADPPPGGDQGQKVFVSDAQQFPFYGTIEVSRSS